MNSSLRSLRCAAVAALAAALAAAGAAQIKFPAASPHATLKQVVGLTDVEIDYSRPSVKGRQIFGGLVPWGEVWRTGANEPTKITFSDEVTLGDATVPAGAYALYTIPQKDSWTIIVYGTTEGWGSFGYDQSKDVARFTAKPSELAAPVETFTIGIGDLRNDSATLHLDWDRTRVSIPIKVPTTARVMSQIDSAKDTPAFKEPNTLFGAGSFYHDAGHDLPQALNWIATAIDSSERPGYWMYARKARLEIDLGRKEAAKISAEKTLELATQAGNGDYQKIAKDLLASL